MVSETNIFDLQPVLGANRAKNSTPAATTKSPPVPVSHLGADNFHNNSDKPIKLDPNNPSIAAIGVYEKLEGVSNAAKAERRKIGLDPSKTSEIKANLENWIFNKQSSFEGRSIRSQEEFSSGRRWDYGGICGEGDFSVYDPYTGTIMKFETKEEAETAETFIKERRATDLLLASSLSPRAVESVLQTIKIENPLSQAAIDLNTKLEANLNDAVGSEAKSMSTSELMYFASKYPGNSSINEALHERFAKLDEKNISVTQGLKLTEDDLEDNPAATETGKKQNPQENRRLDHGREPKMEKQYPNSYLQLMG